MSELMIVMIVMMVVMFVAIFGPGHHKGMVDGRAETAINTPEQAKRTMPDKAETKNLEVKP
ncbi:MAG: hypothetical protein HY272_08700 [Gammaproteobacteria bacterium]|nr:hypothetical protein [Gammaproteobacteria bacterium]